ncbi:MAG: lysoplasmalogenase [Bacteroidetes bacterium]|nr:lysoplasmalogenase [Bacteroidota bacterium]MBT7094323.1 lysoplasmalogenase [Bacteroidota bacterium]
MKVQKSILIAVFLILVIVELLSRWLENHTLEYVAKPFLMIWIAVFFVLYSKKKSFRTFVLMAFFFSWLGDMFLMLSHQNEILFYAGVGGFFFAQIMYILVFIRFLEIENKGFLRRKPWWLVIFLVYLAGVLIMLFPDMDGFMRPVILIYSISLIGMSIFALNRKHRVRQVVFLRVFIGSVFFVISDTLIALDKFTLDIPKASFLIILTYIIAQTLIMSGLVEENEKN